MSKIYAVMSGADWSDANVSFLVVDGELDVDKEQLKHKAYLKESRGTKLPYITLEEWLIKAGARLPNDDEFGEVWDE